MKDKRMISGQLVNTLLVMLGNLAALLNGVITGFVVPKILPVEGYGYSKVFTLYGTYLGMCHLGIIDGIVLVYGGNDYSTLPRQDMRWYWKWYLLVNGSGAALISLLALIAADRNMRFLAAALAVELLAVNTVTYFQQISQITQRFREYTHRKVVYSTVGVLSTLGLGLLYKWGNPISYQSYLLVHLAMNMAFAVWYLISYREIVWGSSDKLFYRTDRFVQIIRCGFPVLIANMCSTLLLTLDRQFVNLLFDTKTYAVYAFAYNLLSLVSIATSAMSTVMYPFLKRTSERESQELFPQMTYVCLALMLAACAVYFPLEGFVVWFLPHYRQSLLFLRILFPGLALTSSVTVVFQNYEKAEGHYRRYFVKSVTALAVSAMLNCVAYAFFRSPTAISAASVLAALFWYCDVGRALAKTHTLKLRLTIFYSAAVSALFYLTTEMENKVLGCTFYLAGLIAVSIFFYKRIFSKTVMENKNDAID